MAHTSARRADIGETLRLVLRECRRQERHCQSQTQPLQGNAWAKISLHRKGQPRFKQCEDQLHTEHRSQDTDPSAHQGDHRNHTQVQPQISEPDCPRQRRTAKSDRRSRNQTLRDWKTPIDPISIASIAMSTKNCSVLLTLRAACGLPSEVL